MARPKRAEGALVTNNNHGLRFRWPVLTSKQCNGHTHMMEVPVRCSPAHHAQKYWPRLKHNDNEDTNETFSLSKYSCVRISHSLFYICFIGHWPRSDNVTSYLYSLLFVRPKNWNLCLLMNLESAPIPFSFERIENLRFLLELFLLSTTYIHLLISTVFGNIGQSFYSILIRFFCFSLANFIRLLHNKIV